MALVVGATMAAIAPVSSASPLATVSLLGAVGRSDGGSTTVSNGVVVCAAPGIPVVSATSFPTCDNGSSPLAVGVSGADTFSVQGIPAGSYNLELAYVDGPAALVVSGVASVALAPGQVANCTLIAGVVATANCAGGVTAVDVGGVVTDSVGTPFTGPNGLLVCDGMLRTTPTFANLCDGGSVEVIAIAGATGAVAPATASWHVSRLGRRGDTLVFASPDTVTVGAGDELTCEAHVPGATTCTVVSAPSGPPDDGDGVIESPGVDGNGDGIDDAAQANVTTLPSGGTTGNVTIASPGSTTLQAVSAAGVPASPTPPAGAQFPVGVLGFKVAGVGVGGPADVKVYMPAGSSPSGYLKLRGGAWLDFSSHVTINGDVVTLHLVDNDSFDTDPAVGVIGDPGAPVVGYKFSGFRSPIDAVPAVNSAKGGQAIPVKWRITTATGVPVSDPSSFVSLTSSGGACGAGTTDEVEAYVPGASGLQYLGNGEWQMNWKTEKAWAGQCRTLTLKLADGLESRTASFKFK